MHTEYECIWCDMRKHGTTQQAKLSYIRTGNDVTEDMKATNHKTYHQHNNNMLY